MHYCATLGPLRVCMPPYGDYYYNQCFWHDLENFLEIYILSSSTLTTFIITHGSFEDHINRVKNVLRRLQEENMQVNTHKTIFCTKEVDYLGFVLTKKGIKPQSKKVMAIQNLDRPQSSSSVSL